MLVHGREVKFLRTVWAVNEIAKICPMKNIGRFNEILKSESTIEVNDTWSTFICSLNMGYEMAQKFVDKDYVSNPLTEEELVTLTEEEFSVLLTEAMQAWFGDKVTVEAEEPKKKDETSETSD